MFETKNLSPQKLTLLTSLALSIPITIGIYLLEKSFLIAAVSLALIFIGSYILIYTIFQKFIYRKIKLIYKFIYQTKATKREETYYEYILPKKSIDEVREDVEAWAQQRTSELEMLKKNESFRKDFLQNLSHEFKTPVFAIQGYVDTLLNGGLENPAINRKFLEKTFNNVERLTTLLQDLDSISKLERGEIKLIKQYFVIQDLAKEAFENLSLKADQNNISFLIKKGCEKHLTVYADKEKIKQVFTNLIDNSIKYGKLGGSIIFSSYEIDEERILIEVSDDGIGIPENSINRIFERFYRTESGRSKEVKGSGLGLSICKHIIEAHGQNMHVRSKENIGTTIGFTLDARRKEHKMD